MMPTRHVRASDGGELLAGNSWGTDADTGQSCIGCGNQEQFYGCSDVAIADNQTTYTPPTTTTTTTQTPNNSTTTQTP